MEGRKKVLFLITKSNFGGAQRYVHDLATHLPKEHFEAAVAAGPVRGQPQTTSGHEVQASNGAGDGGLLFDKLHKAGVRTIPIPSLGRDVSLLADVRAFFEILSIVRREKPDVLHLNSSKIGALGALAGRLLFSRRIIFTAHGWEFNAPRSWPSRFVIRLLSIFTVLLAHRTITVSEDLRSYMPRLLRRKIIVVHNGIDSVATLPRDAAGRFLTEAGVPLDRPIIGTLAELHPVKGLRYAIEAIARLREGGVKAALVVMGEGDEREALERLIHGRNLQDSVFLLGFVQNAPQYLSAFTIFTLPSLYEGLSYALLEAGSAGLPVAASRVGGIPEIIEDGVSGILVAPKNPTALAEAFRVLLSDAGRYGAALQERVHTNFSLRRMLEKTTALY